MGKAFKDQPFSYRQDPSGSWAATDQRLELEATGATRQEAYDRLCALVMDRLQLMSADEWEVHLAGCEAVELDGGGNLKRTG